MPPFTIFLVSGPPSAFCAYKVCVNTGLGNQLFVLALLYHTPVVDNKNLIRETDDFQIVRNHNYRFVELKCFNRLLQLPHQE